jgi:hypothetical protein
VGISSAIKALCGSQPVENRVGRKEAWVTVFMPVSFCEVSCLQGLDHCGRERLLLLSISR